MSQWALRCALLATNAATAVSHQHSFKSKHANDTSRALYAWMRCYSTSSIPDRRKRNHFKSNKRDAKKKTDDSGKAATNNWDFSSSTANGKQAEEGSNKSMATGNWELFGNPSHTGTSGSHEAAGKAGVPNGKSDFRNTNKKNRQTVHKRNNKGGNKAKDMPVFTNKFQNLLSFAFEDDLQQQLDTDDNGKSEPKSRTKSTSKVQPKQRSKKEDNDDDIFTAEGTNDLALSALGLDFTDDFGDNDEEPFKKQKHSKPKDKLASTDVASSTLLSAGVVAGTESRKVLKKQKKKDGRSLLKNFRFENSLFDDDMDLFGHIDWDDQGDKENREQRRYQRNLRKQAKQTPKVMLPPQEIEIPTKIAVKDLAERMCVKSRVLLRALQDLGESGLKEESILTNDIAELVVESLNMIPILLPPDFVDLELTVPPADCSMFPTRPPIISVMGHVDHGKTTLLDALRKSNVAASEAGGITQGIGAFTVDIGKKFGNQSTMTFIDTPGHAAFSNMRSRGSEVTDMIVLVVAADDGVRPQTVEVVQLAMKNNVPLVVAVTKCDMHVHDQQEVIARIGQELLNQGIVVETLDGDTPIVCVSGKTGEGLDELKETIALHAELMDLRADSKGKGEAVVLEANIARGVGTQVDAIVKWGTLENGSIVVCGLEYGKVRALVDQTGKRVKKITPGNPVRIIGLKGVPNAGDALFVVESEERAKEVIEQRQELLEWDVMASAEEDEEESTGRLSHRRKRLERTRRKWQQVELRRRKEAEEAKRLASLKAGEEGYVANVVPIIVKTDAVGVIAAIDDLIASLPSDEAVIKRIMASVGPVTSSDIAMAETTGATIYAFNVKHPSTIDKEALDKNVSLRQHRVIYSMLDDIKDLLRENLSVIEQTEIVGSAEVIQPIPITTSGRRTINIAGCKVTMGSMTMQAKYRLIRDGETISENITMESMRHFQQKVAEVTKGQECGLHLDGVYEFQPGDQLQAYVIKLVKQDI